MGVAATSSPISGPQSEVFVSWARVAVAGPWNGAAAVDGRVLLSHVKCSGRSEARPDRRLDRAYPFDPSRRLNEE